MQVIIPMTGYGSRFAAAGFKELKPLIKVQGRRIIDWIVTGMFTPEDNFIFICRDEHLKSRPGLEAWLLSLAPRAQVFTVEHWQKLGPVSDVLRASELFDDTAPAMICYCDFYCTFDSRGFLKEALRRGCAGAVPCYSGFHPHLLPPQNLYASCLTDEHDNLIEIREKFSFESDKTRARHSPGLYFFRSGALLKHYLKAFLEQGQALNGEYYASLPYNLMVHDGQDVWCPVNVPYFCQWGTPQDLKDYLFWTEAVRAWTDTAQEA